jgi:signal transduction histidine kinase
VIARSLRWRLLLAAAAAILVALAIAWAFMTLLFGRHLERQLEVEMTRGALVLVAGLELPPAGAPTLAAQPVDPRLDKPAGGYYWQVSAREGALRSRSLWDAALPVPADVPADGWRMRRAPGPFGQPVAVLERSLVIDSDHAPVVVQMAQDTTPLATARAGFARELAVFLAILWAVLSAAAWLQVKLGLLPLARIRGDLVKLEEDADARLPPARLREIQPLVQAINSLADARAGELEFARHRAADLAHGLKTPLAALAAQSRRAREAGADSPAEGMDRAIAVIGRVVEAELARMRLARMGRLPGASANVRAVVERLVNVLEHTEQGGQLAFAIDIPAALQLSMQDEHLSEIVGAVLENAVKYARRQVRIIGAAGPEWTSLSVEDDGAGIPPQLLEQALVRGSRLDEAGGSGLGLSIAREMVEASHGRILLDASPLGGLRVRFAWGAGVAV